MEAKLCVQVELPNGLLLQLSSLKPRTLVSVVKDRIEQQAGILAHTYRLTYLDAAPLEDHKTLGELDVVCGGTLRAVTWRLWHEVVTAALQGDVMTCLRELRAIGDRGDAEWQAYCSWCTLYTSAHNGHYVLICDLLKEWPTVTVNAQTPRGWTALHAAARMGRWKALCVLIDNGADVRMKDKKGRSAADLAHSNGHKKCEQSLRFCEWNIKKYGIMRQRMQMYDPTKERNAATRRAHQYADSRHAVGLGGPRGQEYMIHTPNPTSVREVDRFRAKEANFPNQKATGVGGQAGKDTKLPPLNPGKRSIKETKPCASSGRIAFDYGWFDKLRAQQLVPTTYHILTYSDPSSSHLQPRSLLNPGGYTSQTATSHALN